MVFAGRCAPIRYLPTRTPTIQHVHAGSDILMLNFISQHPASDERRNTDSKCLIWSRLRVSPSSRLLGCFWIISRSLRHTLGCSYLALRSYQLQLYPLSYPARSSAAEVGTMDSRRCHCALLLSHILQRYICSY